MVFYAWNVLLTMMIFYDTFTVPFTIALNYDIEGIWLAIDVIAILIYMIDIFMRSRTAITKSLQLCLDRSQVMHHYVNSWLILDILACLPIEYIMLSFSSPSLSDYTRYLRLLRLLKFGRFYELSRLIQTQSDFPSAIFVFVKLFFVFVLSAHFMSCIYIFIGMRSSNEDRFDG